MEHPHISMQSSMHPKREQCLRWILLLFVSFVVGAAFTPKFKTFLDFFEFLGWVLTCISLIYQVKIPYFTIFNKHDKRIKEFFTSVYFIISTLFFMSKFSQRCFWILAGSFLAYFYYNKGEPIRFRIAAALQCGWIVQIFERNEPARWSPREKRMKVLDGLRSYIFLMWVTAAEIDIYEGFPRHCMLFEKWVLDSPEGQNLASDLERTIPILQEHPRLLNHNVGALNIWHIISKREHEVICHHAKQNFCDFHSNKLMQLFKQPSITFLICGFLQAKSVISGIWRTLEQSKPSLDLNFFLMFCVIMQFLKNILEKKFSDVRPVEYHFSEMVDILHLLKNDVEDSCARQTPYFPIPLMAGIPVVDVVLYSFLNVIDNVMAFVGSYPLAIVVWYVMLFSSGFIVTYASYIKTPLAWRIFVYVYFSILFFHQLILWTVVPKQCEWHLAKKIFGILHPDIVIGEKDKMTFNCGDSRYFELAINMTTINRNLTSWR